MKPATHTPGPWKVAAMGIEDEGTREIIDEKGNCVARMSSGGNSIHLAARARLIASAPDLLDALKKVSAFLEDLSKSNPGYLGRLTLQDYGMFNEALIAMPKAIAKAEGRG